MYKQLFLILICFLLLLPNAVQASLDFDEDLFPKEDYQVLLTYSTAQNEENENVLKLAYLLRHFTDKVTVKPINQVLKSDVTSASYIVYFGEEKEKIDESTLKAINQGDQKVIIIGNNLKQFGDYSSQIKHINRIETPSQSMIDYTQEQEIHIIDEKYVDEVYINGYERNDMYPVFSKLNQDTFYYGVERISKLNMFTLAEIFHEIMENHHQEGHPAFVEIKDINPLTDAKKLKKITDKLIGEKMTFTLNVSPVYRDQDDSYTLLRENKDLIKLLKTLQKDYGTIVASEYITNPNSQERTSYWDLTLDQPVWHENYDEVNESFQSETDFPNETAYMEYLKDYHQVEKDYLNEQLNKSIDVLTRYDLMPLAVDIPFSAISRSGYRALDQKFNYMIGKVHWQDQTMESIQSVPFSSTIPFTDGLTLLPNVDNVQSLYTDERNFTLLLLVRDSFIIKGYSMYEDEDQLDKIINQYHNLPNLSWLDLKNVQQSIQSNQTKVDVKSDGTIEMDRNIAFWQDLLRDNHYTKFEIGLWLLSLVIILFITVFLVISFSLRLRIRRRLFEERGEK